MHCGSFDEGQIHFLLDKNDQANPELLQDEPSYDPLLEYRGVSWLLKKPRKSKI